MEARNHLDGKLLFALLAAAVAGVLFWNTWPLYPFKLLVVLMHESGHAAATLLVGGSVEAIRINPYQGGVTLSRFPPSLLRENRHHQRGLRRLDGLRLRAPVARRAQPAGPLAADRARGLVRPSSRCCTSATSSPWCS